MFYENWRTAQDLDEHLTLPHLANLLVGSLLIGMINDGLIIEGLTVSQQMIVRGAIVILATALGARGRSFGRAPE